MNLTPNLACKSKQDSAKECNVCAHITKRAHKKLLHGNLQRDQSGLQVPTQRPLRSYKPAIDRDTVRNTELHFFTNSSYFLATRCFIMEMMGV